MVNLEFCKQKEATREEVVNTFYEYNIKHRQKAKISKLNIWCNKYLKDVKQTDGKPAKTYDFEAVVKALPGELISMKNHLDKVSGLKKIMDELSDKTYKGNSRIYVKDTLYKNMEPKARRWIIDSLNVTVCPYCNRNYVFSKDDADTCDLDHFIPEGKYPIFATSFYNLIPSCPVCNRKKNDAEFLFYAHDIRTDIDEKIVFTYFPIADDYMTNPESIIVHIDAKPGYENQIKKLELDKIYQRHNDVAYDIVRKNHILNKTYRANLYKEFNDLFTAEEEVDQLVFGTSMDVSQYGLHPLSKMTADIRKEIEKE